MLRGTSLQINPGEHVGLVGRNGAGKSTIFRLVRGEESADQGDVVKARGVRLGLLDQHIHFEAGSTVHESALAAFGHLQQIEHEMHELEHRMADAGPDLEKVLERYSDLQHQFEYEGGFEYAAKAEAILQGLGFDRDMWSLETSKLSGGQQNRLGLVRLLLAAPDVLLLDEPTNHLDVNAVEWLEEFLQGYESAYVIVSHDRYFLDRVATQILALDGLGGAEHYDGDYTEYHDWKLGRRESATPIIAVEENLVSVASTPVPEPPPPVKKTPPAPRKPGIKVVKKKKSDSRTPELVESDISRAEQRLNEISQQMGTPEVARDHDRLIALNDEYQQTESLLRTLYEEWDRVSLNAESVR